MQDRHGERIIYMERLWNTELRKYHLKLRIDFRVGKAMDRIALWSMELYKFV